MKVRAFWRERLNAGAVISFFFLVSLVQAPIGEITEVLDQTQTAVAGWNKVLTLLDHEPELVERPDGDELPTGPLSIEVVDLVAGYDGTAIIDGEHVPALGALTGTCKRRVLTGCSSALSGLIAKRAERPDERGFLCQLRVTALQPTRRQPACRRHQSGHAKATDDAAELIAETREERADQAACGVRHVVEADVQRDSLGFGELQNEVGVERRVQREDCTERQEARDDNCG